MPRVLVCGGQNYENESFVWHVLDTLHNESPISLLIHGACGWNADSSMQRPMTGADAWADGWAIARQVPKQRCPASWTSLGRAAGPIRNTQMLRHNPDLVIAFPGSRGTADMVRKARKAGIRVIEVKEA